jgi:hypothetical protein
MNIRRRKMFLRSRVWPVRRVDNLAAIFEPTVGSLTSHNPIGLHGVTGIAFVSIKDSRA